MAPTLIARCRATSFPPASSATNAKYCPLTRSTAVTGTTRPGAVFQTMRARTNCEARSDPSLRTRPFTRTDCVCSSTCGEMKLMVVVTSVRWPSLLSTRIGIPRLSSPARSMGTETYSSSVSFWSTVVNIVCVVTWLPTRTGMSPTMPAVGAETV